jgi:hypothetical protein
MKKYFSIEMGSRGEIEIPYITESKDIKSVIKLRKGKLVEDLKSGDMSKSEIKEYMDEWFCTEDYEYGSDVVLGEEESCVYIDMDSDMFKKWEEGLSGDVEGFYWEDVSDEKVWDLLNMFWNGGEEVK